MNPQRVVVVVVVVSVVHTLLSTRMEFSPVNAACPSKTVTPDFSRFLFSYYKKACYFLEQSTKLVAVGIV